MEANHLCAMPSVLWSYHARVPSSRHPPFSNRKILNIPLSGHQSIIQIIFLNLLGLLQSCFQGRGRGDGRGARGGGGGKPRGEIF